RDVGGLILGEFRLLDVLERGNHVQGASWSKDEFHVLSWGDGTARVWDLRVAPWVPFPRSASEEDLTLEAEAHLGMRLNQAGDVEPLSRQLWLAQKEQLRQLRAKAAQDSNPCPAPFVSSIRAHAIRRRRTASSAGRDTGRYRHRPGPAR